MVTLRYAIPHVGSVVDTKIRKGSSVKNLGVIGCGLRSDCYLAQLESGLDTEWKLVALADPRQLSLDVYMRNYGNADVRTFSSGPEMLDAMGGQLDAVIIASPNATHLDSLRPALTEDLTILLEKPVATTVHDCAQMWQAYTGAGKPPLAVGFVLRYTTFYGKVKQIIDSGAIGDILSIEAAEMMAPPLTANYMRGWRRKLGMSGPLLLEKCSHDMDLLNWFAGARAMHVTSFGERTKFLPRAEAAMHCNDCRFKDTCRYSICRIAPYLMDTSRRDAVGELIPRHNDLCVYNSDKDVWDHQVVNLRYENGVLVTFTVCTDQPRTTRTIKVNGTDGEIIGDIGLDQLRVEYHSETKNVSRVEEVSVDHDTSGHHGGDSVISNQFKAMLRDEPVPPLAGLAEGIDACLVALGAEEAAVSHAVIDLDTLRSTVYG